MTYPKSLTRLGYIVLLIATVLLLLFALSGPTQAGSDRMRGGGRRVNSPDSNAIGCPEAKTWEVEDGLGINKLGDFEPSGIDIIGWFVVAGLALSAILALVVLVMGGVQYVASAGSAGGQSAAKQKIQNALLGLLLALASTLILYTINPNLTTFGIPNLNDYLENGSFGDTIEVRDATRKACAELKDNFGGDAVPPGRPGNTDGGGTILEGERCTGAQSCADGLRCSSEGFCYDPGSAGVGDPCPGGSNAECTFPLLCNNHVCE